MAVERRCKTEIHILQGRARSTEMGSEMYTGERLYILVTDHFFNVVKDVKKSSILGQLFHNLFPFISRFIIVKLT